MCCMGRRIRLPIRATVRAVCARACFFFRGAGPPLPSQPRALSSPSRAPPPRNKHKTDIAGIGLATTTDFRSFNVLNATLMVPSPVGPSPEVCLEAATPPVQLSTGDWLHVFAAGTQGWGPWGPGRDLGDYTAGFLILDKDDPSQVLQRDVAHFWQPTADYEVGENPAWPVCRNRTLFVTSLVPVPGQPDKFIAWFGAADANVATAVVTVHVL